MPSAILSLATTYLAKKLAHIATAQKYLGDAGVEFTYHNVVKDPRALYEMLARVKPIVGPKTPITVPQIWLNGLYIGGADQLSEELHR